MSDTIDPNSPSIRLRVLAKTLANLIPHVRPEILFSDRRGTPTGVTTTTGELIKIRTELERIANEMDPL